VCRYRTRNGGGAALDEIHRNLKSEGGGGTSTVTRDSDHGEFALVEVIGSGVEEKIRER